VSETGIKSLRSSNDLMQEEYCKLIDLINQNRKEMRVMTDKFMLNCRE
jgi:hypothetical protein